MSICACNCFRQAGATPTTQTYIDGDAFDSDPVLRWSPKGTRERLTIALAPLPGRESGALTGEFVVVLAQ
jgi:hypothetical protein